MHVGIVTSVPDKVDWVHTQWNTDPSRCEASLGSWDFIAGKVNRLPNLVKVVFDKRIVSGKFGVCIKYVYSDGKSTSFIQASCNTNDFWNDPDQGEIISFFGPNHDCSGQNASYPFLEVPVEGHVACRETAAEADPYAIGGVCPENFWDLAPVAVPEAPTTVPTTTPSSTPIRIPVAGPSAKSAASVAQMGMVALGLIALAL